MNGKIPKRIVIEEDTGCYGPVTYFSKLIIKKDSMTYQEATEGDTMFYPEKKHFYKYKIESSLFETKFYELASEICKINEELVKRIRGTFHFFDCGLNKITVYYDNKTKIVLYFSRSLYENKYDNIADIIRIMIPNCEGVPGYLMTVEERTNSLFYKFRE